MATDNNISFIYTNRNSKIRFDSKIRYAKKRGIFKQPKESQGEKNIELHKDHFKTCLTLSKRFKKDMLIIDVTKEKNIEKKILNFLGLKDKNIKFPHANKT